MSSTLSPSWPSLYNPGLEILHIAGRLPTQPGGSYLYNAFDIFRFTLYWTLIFYTPFFFLCGFYAFCNYSFPPTRSPRPALYPYTFNVTEDDADSLELLTPGPSYHPGTAYVPLQHLRSPQSPPQRATPASRRSAAQTPSSVAAAAAAAAALRKKNERRSRVAFALLVFVMFISLGLAGAVVGSAVVGFTVMGLYRSAEFSMSTWIPFLMALIQVLVGWLSIWPSIIEII